MNSPSTIPLLTLGDKNILNILNKLDNRTIARMRTTCESMASVIKLNDHELTKRTYFGVSLAYEDCSGDLIYTVRDKTEKVDYDIPEEELMKILSGVPIHKISVSVWEKYFDFVVASLISLEPTCAILCIEDQNPTHIVQITDIVECQGNIDVTLNLSEEFILRGISVTEEELPILANAPKSSTFNVSFEGPFIYYDGMVKDLLKFYTFETQCQIPDIIPLIKELVDCKDFGSLTKFTCVLENKSSETSVFDDDSCPPGTEIHGKNYNDSIFIHSIQLEDKIAVVIEDENFTIHLVNNQYEVLAVISSSVDLSRFMYDDVLVTTESLPMLAEVNNNRSMDFRFFGSFVYYEGMMADILKFRNLTTPSPFLEMIPSLLWELSLTENFGNLKRFTCRRLTRKGDRDISVFHNESCPRATLIWSRHDFVNLPSHIRTGYNLDFEHDHLDYIHTIQVNGTNGKTVVIIEDENISFYLFDNLSEVLDLISSIVNVSEEVMTRILTRNGEMSQQALTKGYNAYLEAVKVLNTRLDSFNFFKDHPDYK